MMVSMWAEPVFVTYLLISFWVGYSFALGGYLYSISSFSVCCPFIAACAHQFAKYANITNHNAASWLDHPHQAP